MHKKNSLDITREICCESTSSLTNEKRRVVNFPGEEWRDINRSGCGGLKISNMGRVKSCRRRNEQLLKLRMANYSSQGSQQTKTTGNGRGGNIWVHMEVLRAFHPNENGDIIGIFVDGDRENCRADNLRWYSQYSAEVANEMSDDGLDIFHKLINELVDLFEKKKPHRINEQWVKENGRTIHQRITAIIRKNKNYVWLRVISLLPNKWESRWIKSGFNFQKLIDELVAFLEEVQPQYFGRGWIQDNNRKLYEQIVANIRKDGKPDWLRVVSVLPEKWQGRWDDGGFNFQKIIDDLLAFLEEAQPQYFSKGWIQNNNNGLYKRIHRNVRKDGKPDWLRVVSSLPKKWQECWISERCSEDNLLKKWRVTTGSYFSKEELDNVLSQYRSYLYLITSSVSTKEEKEMRSEIINSLVELSQRGNNSAREYLVSILELKCSDWAVYDKSISLYEMAHDDLLKKINACINNYDFHNRSSFLHYLYVSLEKHRKALDFSLPLLLDQNEDGSRSLHETIIAHEDWG